MKKSYFHQSLFFLVLIVSVLSCNTEDITQITAIELSSIKTKVADTIVFEFNVRGNNSSDITDQTVIKVNGTPIEGSTYTTPIGDEQFLVQAFYDSLESNLINLNSRVGDFEKNVLIEDYTGTWCGNCPRVAYAIELAKAETDNIVAVAIHTGDDPYSFDASEALLDEMGIFGLPTGRLDRTQTWSYLEPDHVSEAIDRTGFSTFGLAIESTQTASNINTNIHVKFSKTIETELKLVVYLLESGMHHDQVNYTDYFEGDSVDPLVDFEQNHVLRALFTDSQGELIPLTESIEDNEYQLTLNKTIPDSIENSENLQLVAFVIDANTGEVLNARESEVGDDQDYQIVE